ncbi:hypothetical protein IEO21_03444 [Rhodonia placenta]|uniref:Cytochrome P450 n=1 Tax=Rhodonia placenta TaxID=104341 RepID=A0A8H7P5R1_9APHY|nr:hypothetical protein IEO21_03444 [Postia placenta]
MHLGTADVLAIFLAVVVCIVGARWNRSKHRPLPPGPRGVPLLGNIFQIPLENQFKMFTDWGNIYGDVVYAQLFQQPLVIIGSLRAAQELMEKRGAIYSDRPRFVLLQEIYGLKPMTSLIRFGDDWRQQRRWMQDALSTYNTIRSYRPLQMNEVNKLIARFATSPDSFFTHVQR